MPTVSSSFWILSVLVIQLYLLMYMFFFTSAIYLRYKYPNVKRPYQLPGKNFGMWFTASIGLVAAIFVFFISFWPPAELPTGSPRFFVWFLIVGIVVMVSIPLIVYHFKDKWS